MDELEFSRRPDGDSEVDFPANLTGEMRGGLPNISSAAPWRANRWMRRAPTPPLQKTVARMTSGHHCKVFRLPRRMTSTVLAPAFDAAGFYNATTRADFRAFIDTPAQQLFAERLYYDAMGCEFRTRCDRPDREKIRT